LRTRTTPPTVENAPEFVAADVAALGEALRS